MEPLPCPRTRRRAARAQANKLRFQQVLGVTLQLQDILCGVSLAALKPEIKTPEALYDAIPQAKPACAGFLRQILAKEGHYNIAGHNQGILSVLYSRQIFEPFPIGREVHMQVRCGEYPHASFDGAFLVDLIIWPALLIYQIPSKDPT